MERRTFLSLGAVGAFGLLRGIPRVHAQDPPQADDIPYGETRLAISDEDRQGSVYVPKIYKHGTKIPVLMMLHGLGGSSQGVRYTFPLAEEFGVVVIAPESRDQTWGQAAPGFDADSHYLSAAIRAVNDFLDVDRTHIAIGGVSDGATYALAMGLAYGGAPFTHLMGFSEGIINPYRKQGKPKIFIAHGVTDYQMPIDRTSRRFVPQMKMEGYDVTYQEYDGGHGAPSALVRQAFEWFVPKNVKPL